MFRSCTIPFMTLLGICLSGCASAPHVAAFQEAPMSGPRTLALAIEKDEILPFGIRRDDVARAAAQAGFVEATDAPPRYRLYLTAAAGTSAGGSFLPNAKRPPDWVARADTSWRARAAGGATMRVTAVLVEVAANREIWRGAGTARTRDTATAARDLVEQLLAKLPRG